MADWNVAGAALPGEFGVLLLLALLVSSVGFYRFVYFISIGYGYSVTAMAGAAVLLFRAELSVFTVVQAVLLAAYGLRLGTYLLLRELRTSYRQRELDEVNQRSAGITRPIKVLIWGVVALLYVLMISPLVFNLAAERATGVPANPAIQTMGVIIAALGLGLEAAADRQKSAYKARNASRFCDEGLYRVVRYPNYLGEVIFWLGNWTAGLAAYTHGLAWAISLVGLVAIVLIMINSTMMLERKQDDRYGDRDDYQDYRRSVPILFPLVPVYTFRPISSRIDLRL
jgi:steroid 5-alpha reductase family enzyme